MEDPQTQEENDNIDEGKVINEELKTSADANEESKSVSF